MNQNLLNVLFNSLLVLLIVVVFALIWFVVWTCIKFVITMKDDILKEREQARLDLLEIQAAKAIEWDKYKEVSDERDKLRQAYFGEKEAVEKLKEEKASLTVHNDNLAAINRELKKGSSTATTVDKKAPKKDAKKP